MCGMVITDSVNWQFFGVRQMEGNKYLDKALVLNIVFNIFYIWFCTQVRIEVTHVKTNWVKVKSTAR